ncbi:MAG: hypothetical protein HY909_24745 [Deltaproteobacteria bacterium]|nr:hypothetical protein [Deltaproteobacteria bacterium]
MIQAGESLGNRYQVATAPDELRAGAVFDVVDRGATVRAQVLSTAPAPPAVLESVRAELASAPAMPNLVRPKDFATTPGGCAVSILDRPGLVPLRPRVAALAVEKGRRTMVLSLLRWIAGVATDLAQSHNAGVVHGAISARVLLCNPRAEHEPCLLSGFGIGAIQKRVDPAAPETSRRGDLLALIEALSDLLEVVGAQPEGGAAAKWTLLLHAVRHGEHPALGSGTALATTLNEIATLGGETDKGPPRRLATMAPPAPSGATPVPAVGRKSSTPPPPSGPGGRASRSEPAPVPKRPGVSLPLVLAGALGIAGGVGGFVWYAVSSAEDLGVGSLRRVRRAPRRPACTGETLQPEAHALDRRPEELSVTCAGGRLLAAVRLAGEVTLAGRPARRGERFAAARTPVARGVVELGTALPDGEGAWLAWRNGLDAPFGMARLGGAAVDTWPVNLPGWENVPLRGAWVLHATARSVYVATSVAAPDGSGRTVLLDVAPPGVRGRPPVVVWAVADVRMDAATTGPEPVLLLHQREETRHTLSAAVLNLAALAASRAPSEPVSLRGEPLPAAAVTRLAGVTVDAPAVVPVAEGAGRSFLFTSGPVQLTEACAVSWRCVGPGRVGVLTFPAEGAASVQDLRPRASAVSLLQGEAGALTAAVREVSAAGQPATGLELVAAGPAPTPAGRVGPSVGRARFTACGGESWALDERLEPTVALASRPVQCLR